MYGGPGNGEEGVAVNIFDELRRLTHFICG